MKPIKLIISAFGPYAGVTPEINFEKFEERGLVSDSRGYRLRKNHNI